MDIKKAKSSKALLKVALDFQKKMQKMCNDNKSGITSIEFSVNGEKPIVIAEKKDV